MRSFHKFALLVAGMLGEAAFAAPVPGTPATDPPVEVGEAYAIDGMTVTPADGPFDEVGLAVADPDTGAGPGISMAHRTLPLPSYTEVTALDSGRTILVRTERRGPLSGSAFVALSTGAFAQIGADPAVPLGVRVRRVSPQEYERSLLRTGQRAPERLVTPKPLLEVLRRRLAEKSPPPLPTIRSVQAVDSAPSNPTPAADPVLLAPAPPKVVVDKPSRVEAKPPVTKTSATYAVQVAAFGNRAAADSTAKKLGGTVSSAGNLWRVRTGPFATRAEAAAGQAKARKAGFADAQVVAARVVPIQGASGK